MGMDKIVLGFWSVVPAVSPCRSEHALSKSLGCRLWEAALQSCPHHSAAASGTDSAPHVTHLSKDDSKDDNTEEEEENDFASDFPGLLPSLSCCISLESAHHISNPSEHNDDQVLTIVVMVM